MIDPILAVTWGQRIIAFLFVAVCILLILIVLLQKGRGGGLSGAFGGVGGHSAFGAKTGDVFTWITVGLTFFFILIAVIGNWVFIPPSGNPPSAAMTPTPVRAPANNPGAAPSRTLTPEKPAAPTSRPN